MLSLLQWASWYHFTTTVDTHPHSSFCATGAEPLVVVCVLLAILFDVNVDSSDHTESSNCMIVNTDLEIMLKAAVVA